MFRLVLGRIGCRRGESREPILSPSSSDPCKGKLSSSYAVACSSNIILCLVRFVKLGWQSNTYLHLELSYVGIFFQNRDMICYKNDMFDHKDFPLYQNQMHKKFLNFFSGLNCSGVFKNEFIVYALCSSRKGV